MMKRYSRIALVIAVAVLIGGSYYSGGTASNAATQTASAQAPGYGIVTADELIDMLKSKDFTLVNVHVPYEGELPQTDLIIPYNEIDRYLYKLPADKNAKIVLYCKTDRMSRIAAERLAGLGYTNVWDVKGGMVEWRQKGYPLLNASL